MRRAAQAWLPELGMYHYKARIYSPTLGRFLQTDPIGYDDQVNLYAYVGNDPVNGADPSGMQGCENVGCDVPEITVTAGGCSFFSCQLPKFLWGSIENERKDKHAARCGQGRRIVITPFGIGATGFVVLGGFSLTAEAGISIPISAADGDFRGTQFYASATAVQLLGLGAFVGAGNYFGVGTTTTPISTGTTGLSDGKTPPSVVIQGGAALAAGAEAQVDLSAPPEFASPAMSGGAGPKVGYGAYLAGGIKHVATLASPELCY